MAHLLACSVKMAHLWQTAAFSVVYVCTCMHVCLCVDFCVDLACSVKMPPFWTDGHILCYLLLCYVMCGWVLVCMLACFCACVCVCVCVFCGGMGWCVRVHACVSAFSCL